MENINFIQLCVMKNTILGENEIEEFEEFFKSEGFRVKFEKQVKTTIILDDDSHIEDIFFYIHSDDIGKFAIWRLETPFEISWYEDMIDNYKHRYSFDILQEYTEE